MEYPTYIEVPEDYWPKSTTADNFDEIAEGTKTIEYRDKTDYWKKRLENREYDVIKFRNGYAKDAPTMLVEYVGLNVGNPFSYVIQLGKVLEVHNDNW